MGLLTHRTSVDSSSWTPISVSSNCSRVSLKLDDTANKMKVRTTAADSGTEEPAISGGVAYILDTQPEFSIRNDRLYVRHIWTAGTVVCYVQTTGGVGPVVVTEVA